VTTRASQVVTAHGSLSTSELSNVIRRMIDAAYRGHYDLGAYRFLRARCCTHGPSGGPSEIAALSENIEDTTRRYPPAKRRPRW
jgi:hypothetical protein